MAIGQFYGCIKALTLVSSFGAIIVFSIDRHTTRHACLLTYLVLLIVEKRDVFESVRFLHLDSYYRQGEGETARSAERSRAHGKSNIAVGMPCGLNFKFDGSYGSS